MTAITPQFPFVEGHPLDEGLPLRARSTKARFWNWVTCWLALPNLPYLAITVIGGPPRYAEISLCAGVGLAVRQLPYAVRLTAFVMVMGIMLAFFISHMFNMNVMMLMFVAPLVTGINLASSFEYVMGAALLLITLMSACWLLRRQDGFTGTKWLIRAICLTLLASAFDYTLSRKAMGSYSRFAPAGAPFTSATKQADLMTLADGKTNILLVVVESMGEPHDKALRARFDQIWMRPELARKYEIVRGSTRFYGSTTKGEIRELCQRWGDYPEITKADRTCLPHLMVTRGYGTTAYHPFHGSFFERDTWYPLIGLQRSLFRDELLKEGAQLCPSIFEGACDRDIPDRIARRLIDASKPQFIYWLTLNSHLPIVETGKLRTNRCSRLGGTTDKDLPMVCRLFAVWEDTADALFRTVGRPDFPPTHILIVGDHMPPLTRQRSRLQFEPDRVPWILLRSRKVASDLGEAHSGGKPSSAIQHRRSL